MSSNPNKASALGAIIIMMTACSIIISAQTLAVVNSLTAKPDPKREIKETASKERSGPASEGTDPSSGPAATSAVNSRTERSDPVRAKADTKVAAGDDRREAIRKVPTGPQTASSDEWQFQFSPFFHLAGLHGTAGIGNRTTQVEESFSDLFHVLNFAFMGTFEARKGKLVSLTDLEYVNVSDDKATPGPLFSNVKPSVNTFIFD